MLSVATLGDLITAHAALDTLEMEHHAAVYISLFIIKKKKGNKFRDACLDIHARGFWERQRSAFFDVWVCPYLYYYMRNFCNLIGLEQ